MRPTLPLAGILAVLAPGLMAMEQDTSGGQSELQFVDLRLSGGVHDGQLGSTDVTLMAGNVGDKSSRTVDTWSDAGIVLGLRGMWDYGKAKIGDGVPDYKTRMAGLELILGVAFVVNDADDLELCVGYGRGDTTDATSSSWHRNGSFVQYMGELGYYHQLIGPLQIGAALGYGYDKIKLDGPEGGSFSGNASGVDLTIELGWRF